MAEALTPCVDLHAAELAERMLLQHCAVTLDQYKQWHVLKMTHDAFLFTLQYASRTHRASRMRGLQCTVSMSSILRVYTF